MVPLHSKGVIRRHRLRRVRQSREIDKTRRKKKNRKRRRCSKRERSSRVGEGTLWGRNVFILRSSSVLQSLSTGSPFPFLFSDALPHPLESLPNSHTGTSPTTTTIENDDDDDARCRLGFLTHSFAHLQLFQHAFDATAWGCPLVSLYITEYTERERERERLAKLDLDFLRSFPLFRSAFFALCLHSTTAGCLDNVRETTPRIAPSPSTYS